MKYALILLMLPVFGFSQKDTVIVAMLISDTTETQYVRTGVVFLTSPPQYETKLIRTSNVYWRYGYLVRERHEGTDPAKLEEIFGKPGGYIGDNNMYIVPSFRFDNAPKSFYYTIISYLDKDKVPLSKNIIVWQYK